MRSQIRSLVVTTAAFAALVLAPLPARAQAEVSDAEAIASLRQKFVAAFNRADVEGMADMVTDDVVTMPPNQPAVVGKDATRSWWSEGFDAARSHLEVSAQELEVAGDWAFDRLDWTMETTPTGGGETTRDNGKSVWIWRQQPDGSWQIARSIWNSDNEVPGLWSGAPRS